MCLVTISSHKPSHCLRYQPTETRTNIHKPRQPLSYLPLSLWSWQDAVKAVFCGKVTVVDVYPDISVRTASIEVPLPSIIALTDYVQPKNQKPAFTRRNVFLRDEYRCQYCDQRFHTADLSLDHVIPRSAGGVLSWYVQCCSVFRCMCVRVCIVRCVCLK